MLVLLGGSVPRVIEHAIFNLFATVAAMDTAVFAGAWLLERWLYKRRVRGRPARRPRDIAFGETPSATR